MIVEVSGERLFIRFFLFELAILRSIAWKKHWQMRKGLAAAAILINSMLAVLQLALWPGVLAAIAFLPISACINGVLAFGINGWRELVIFGKSFFQYALLIAGAAYGLKRLQLVFFPGRELLGTAIMTAWFLLFPVIQKQIGKRKEAYTVCLLVAGGKYRMRALKDTGNRLTEPSTQKEVYVLYTQNEMLLEALRRGKQYKLPCLTAKGEGSMIAYQGDELIIFHDGGRQTIWCPMIALGEGKTQDNYMILNAVCG